MKKKGCFPQQQQQQSFSQFVMTICVFVLAMAGDTCAFKKVGEKVNLKPSKERLEPKKVISLVESIQKSQQMFREQRSANAMQNYWKQVFDEIRNVDAPQQRDEEEVPIGLLERWKQFLDDDITAGINVKNGKKTPRRPRFEGFASWDRLVQAWTEDVEEYLEANGFKLDHHTSFTTTDPTHLLPKTPVLPTPRPIRKGEAVVPHTDVSDLSKSIWIVTTASLPWKTGTAVNPLLRAAQMTIGRKRLGGKVTLMLPWLERRDDQQSIYGRVFESQKCQEDYIRTWLRDTANMKQASKDLNIAWYTGRVEKAENSIYSMGDITALIPVEDADICILEEPEHLNWYRAPGESWTTKFKHVIGIIHTNYLVYAQEQPAAFIRAPGMRLLCSWMCRAHCHRVIKLSGTLEKFAPEKECVENVHGVRATFLDIGKTVRGRLRSPMRAKDPVFAPQAEPSVYFIGKMLWSKGLGSMMELLKYAEESAGLKLNVDMYGGGPDKDAADAKAEGLGLNFTFHGPLDHADLAFSHKIFINPSTSEVLCTTVAEALAMGKFVILPSHPSNDFFEQFPNCLPYSTKEEFVGNLYYALTHSPEPLSNEYAYAFSWEAATKRLEAAGSISVKEAKEMAAAMDSGDATVEIGLPPLIEDEERRELIASRFKGSREQYRNFRARLSEEIRQSKVLPKDLQVKFINELDKRLDIDIDQILESPSLRLQLSPAELDKLLREFYETASKSPGGDVIRLVCGGTNVGLQNFYMKRQAQKRRRKERRLQFEDPSSQSFADIDEVEAKDLTAAQRVRKAIRKNLPAKKLPSATFIPKSKLPRISKNNKTSMHLDGHTWGHYRSEVARASYQGSFARLSSAKAYSKNMTPLV